MKKFTELDQGDQVTTKEGQTKEGQMKYHEMQAYWWMHAASNGHATTHNIYHGIQGEEFTDKEKRDRAMVISQRHMKIYRELANNQTGK